MNPFVERHRDKISGVLSCFDRVVITGTLPALPAMEGRSPRPVVPGRRQAVKQGRRAKRQRPCCKLHPSAVEPFVGVLRSLRRACDGVAKRHGRRAAGAKKAVALASRFWGHPLCQCK